MNNDVKTWADEFGRWHAESETSRLGMMWAVNAIAREIFEREDSGSSLRECQEYVANSIVRIPSDKPGRVHFAEYAID